MDFTHPYVNPLIKYSTESVYRAEERLRLIVSGTFTSMQSTTPPSGGRRTERADRRRRLEVRLREKKRCGEGSSVSARLARASSSIYPSCKAMPHRASHWIWSCRNLMRMEVHLESVLSPTPTPHPSPHPSFSDCSKKCHRNYLKKHEQIKQN